MHRVNFNNLIIISFHMIQFLKEENIKPEERELEESVDPVAIAKREGREAERSSWK